MLYRRGGFLGHSFHCQWWVWRMPLCEGGTNHKEQDDSWSEIIDSMVLPGWEHWGWLNGTERKIKEFRSSNARMAWRECSASTTSTHGWYWILFKAKVSHHLKAVLQKENYKWASNALDHKMNSLLLGHNKVSKVLTDYTWRSVFDPQNPYKNVGCGDAHL